MQQGCLFGNNTYLSVTDQFDLGDSSSSGGQWPSARNSLESGRKQTGLTFFFPRQVKYHEDFEKNKGTFTPVVTDPITERVKKNMQDFSDISYRGIQRRVVEMEQKRVDQDQENNLTGKQKLHYFTYTEHKMTLKSCFI